MKRLFGITLFILLFVLVGCKEEVTKDPAPTQPKEEQDTNEDQSNSPNDKDDSSEKHKGSTKNPIKKEEPEKQYPVLNEDITTFVLKDGTNREADSLMLSTEKSHQFNVHFDQPMITETVEKSILEELPSEATFEWKDAQNLSLTVPSIPLKNRHTRVEYINLTKAVTKSGKRLNDENKFRMLLSKPNQLYSYSLNASKEQKLSSFQTYYFKAEPLAEDAFVLFQRTEYCECDANYPELTYLYKPGKDPVFYPEGIKMNPMTEGPLIVDPRGFFLSENSPHYDQATQYRVNPEGFVGGARVMPDQKSLIMAVGDNKNDENFDLIVHDLSTQKQDRYKDVIPGMPKSALNGNKTPIKFYSYGDHIGFVAHSEPFNKSYFYDKNTGETKELALDGKRQAHYFYFSADGSYRYIRDEGIYKNDQLIKPLKNGDVHWSPQGNTYAYREYTEDSDVDSYVLSSMDHPELKKEFTLKLDEYIQGFTPNAKQLIVMKKDR
ncbi:hypothetical protein [Pontibacillus marinus]|uniref:Uncharacterized protein n=1 Tax=Pontibacillus marinus BH030004 = DSM 16465 TaxID=1385511 RepID=A0A0A5G973_9BACI|nr:hypothetical protein [Pontibacillus marinus]KGX89706.1 hypothetical protein N783_04910 [Pontibacillus marinus BH030004 = DSM 16465]